MKVSKSILEGALRKARGFIASVGYAVSCAQKKVDETVSFEVKMEYVPSPAGAPDVEASCIVYTHDGGATIDIGNETTGIITNDEGEVVKVLETATFGPDAVMNTLAIMKNAYKRETQHELNEKLAHQFFDSINDMDRAMEFYRKDNGMAEDAELTAEQVIEAVGIWASIYKCQNNKLHWHGKSLKAVAANAQDVVDMLFATNVLAWKVDMDDTEKDDSRTIKVGQQVFKYNLDKAKEVYGKDISSDLKNGSIVTSFDKFAFMLYRTSSYVSSVTKHGFIATMSTMECFMAHLNGCAADLELTFDDDTKELDGIATHYEKSAFKETEGIATFVANYAVKKFKNRKLSCHAIGKKAVKELLEDEKANAAEAKEKGKSYEMKTSFTEEEIKAKLLEINPETNVSNLETWNTKFSIFKGRIALSPALIRHLRNHPDAKLFSLNMMDVESKVIDKILEDGIYLVSVDPRDNSKIEEKTRMYFLGQSTGGIKDGTYLFSDMPEDSENVPAQEMPNTYTAMLMLDCCGLVKGKEKFVELYNVAANSKDNRKALQDFEDSAFDTVYNLIAENAHGLARPVDEDGKKIYKVSRSKFIARLALGFSSIMTLPEEIEFGFHEMLEKCGGNVYVVDGDVETVIQDENNTYNVEGPMSIRKVEEMRGNPSDGSTKINDIMAAYLAVLCPDIYFTIDMFKEYVECIRKLKEATKVHEWSRWSRIANKKAKDYDAKLDKIYQRYLELDKLIPGAFQIRNTGGMKTLCVKWNLGAINSAVVGIKKDNEELNKINANLIDKPLCDAFMISDTNAFKYLCDGWDNGIFICGHADLNGHDARISQQAWTTLDIRNPKVVLDIIMDMVINPIKTALQSPAHMIDYLNAQCAKVSAEDMANGGVNDLLVMKNMLAKAPGVFYTREFNLALSKHIVKLLDNTQKASLRVKGSRFMYAVADPYAHLNLLLKEEMEAAAIKNGVDKDKYKLDTMEEIFSGLNKKLGKDESLMFISNFGCTKGSASRYPLLSLPEWFKVRIVSDSKFYNGCRGVGIRSALKDIIRSMQGGDDDGDEYVIYPANTKLGKIIYRAITNLFNVGRVGIDDADEFLAQFEDEDTVTCNNENIKKAYAANNVPTDTGIIANSAMALNDVVKHLLVALTIVDTYGLKGIGLISPDETWGVPELDELPRYINAEKNPLNSTIGEADETNPNFSAARSLDGIFIPNELDAIGINASDWTMVSEDGKQRLFTGWIVKDGVVYIEMPFVCKNQWDKTVGDRVWSTYAYMPRYDKVEGERGYIYQKDDYIADLQKNAAFNYGMRFGHILANTESRRKKKLVAETVKGKKKVFMLVRPEDAESLLNKSPENITPINEWSSLDKKRMTIEDIIYILYTMALVNSQECGRAIDSKKHVVGAIYNLNYDCVPSWRLHVNKTKGKEFSEVQARSQFISASVMGAVNALVSYERKGIEATLNKRNHSIVPYLFTLIHEDDEKLMKIEDIADDIREEKAIYTTETAQYTSRQSEEKYAAMEASKARLYGIADDYGVSIETVAIITFFVGCEGNATKNSGRNLNGKIMHDTPSAFSMMLGNEMLTALENADDALTTIRVKKVMNANNLRVHDGWLWYVDEDGEEHLYKRVTYDMDVVYECGDGNIDVINVNGTNYATMYRNTYDPDKKYRSPLSPWDVGGSLSIVFGNKELSKELMTKIEKDGCFYVEFELDMDTKAILAYPLDDDGNRMTKFDESGDEVYLYGRADILESSSVVEEILDANDHKDFNVEFRIGMMLTSIVNTRCQVGYATDEDEKILIGKDGNPRTRVTPGGNITALEIYGYDDI